jgi:hypothetical protein
MTSLSIVTCLGVLAAVLWMLRRDRVSLGLPVAYLFLLLLNHVPGAFAQLMSDQVSFTADWVETGIGLTAIGSVCFLVGVWVPWRLVAAPGAGKPDYRDMFSLFCVIGGWFFNYGVGFLRDIPTLGAAIEKGGGIWMLGVLLGLRAAVYRGDLLRTGMWLAALAVFPLLMLLYGGFLSYGSAAIVIVCSTLAISTRSRVRVAAGIVVAVFLAFTVFVNYFAGRESIRAVVWSGAGLEQRIDAVSNAFTDFEWFDPASAKQQVALNLRLNQNYFIGIAAERLENGAVQYLHGRSVWEALLALVPRALWPDKPVFGGSGDLVREMTGLELNAQTSWGVGNVMEFYINFGIAGLVIGFFLLGLVLGVLGRKAALAPERGNLGKVIVFFLPAVALIQPLGSLVELAGGSGIALIAAYGWKWVWEQLRWAQRADTRNMSGKGLRA